MPKKNTSDAKSMKHSLFLFVTCFKVTQCRQDLNEAKKKIRDIEEAISLEKIKQSLLGSQDEVNHEYNEKG